MTPKEVLALCKSKNVQLVDVKFCDFLGTWQHFCCPIAELEEDQDNPFTMELLVQAYYQTVRTEKLHEMEVKLRGTNVPTMEQALVVPAARARRPTV